MTLSRNVREWKYEEKFIYPYIYSTRNCQSVRGPAMKEDLGPWYKDCKSQDVPSMTLKSDDQIKDAIKRSKMGILNHQTDTQRFLPPHTPDIHSATLLVDISL